MVMNSHWNCEEKQSGDDVRQGFLRVDELSVDLCLILILENSRVCS